MTCYVCSITLTERKATLFAETDRAQCAVASFAAALGVAGD
jgi:hypothetical protein